MKKNRNAKFKWVSSVILSSVLLTLFLSSVTTHADGSSIAGSFRKRGPAKIEDDSNCPQNASASLEKTVTRVLRIQQLAWNRGDIEGFMEYYWKSENLTFSSEGTTKRGWKATRERYKKRYPDRETMGKLTFDRLEVTALGENSALVLGQWHLERKKDNPEGAFSLVMRKIEGKWIIVHDHTSSKPAE